MKKIIALFTGRALLGVFGFYALVAFLFASFLLGLLLKFGVLKTPVFLTRIHLVVGDYLLQVFKHLANNPLDLLFTVLAAAIMSLPIVMIWLDLPVSRSVNRTSDDSAIRGPNIRSRSAVEAQLQSRRLRAQQLLEEQYAKFNVS